MTLRQTIHNISQQHLQNGGMLFGQNLTAVGFVGGTVPNLKEDQGICELPNADSSNGGIVVGAALMGKRPIYTVRYQGFLWFNAVSIANYAAKSKELWDIACPVFMRCISMEKSIGPVAGSSHISLFYKMPGLKIMSPISPKEYEMCYEEFMKDDEVFIINEHRGTFDNEKEYTSQLNLFSTITFLPISITRMACDNVSKKLNKNGINASIIHTHRIKPMTLTHQEIMCLKNSKSIIITDNDYAEGIANNIALDIMRLVGHTRVYVLGLENRSAGFSKETDNLPPNEEQIMKYCEGIV